MRFKGMRGPFVTLWDIVVSRALEYAFVDTAVPKVEVGLFLTPDVECRSWHTFANVSRVEMNNPDFESIKENS